MDIMFMDYAKDSLGQEHFEHWAAHNPRDAATLKYKAWEEAKVAFDGTEGVSIDPMPSLVRAIPEEVSTPPPLLPCPQHPLTPPQKPLCELLDHLACASAVPS